MKAVVRIGGKQFIVTKDETLRVDLLPEGTKELTLEPLMLFDDKDVVVGTPVVQGATVTASVIDEMVKGDKLRIIRFESKKRVKKINGHRQKYSNIKITSINSAKK